MATSTVIAFGMLFLIDAATAGQQHISLASSSQMQLHTAEKRLHNSVSQLASALRSHLGDTSVADARHVLSREADSLDSRLLRDYATWAPDEVLVVQGDGEGKYAEEISAGNVGNAVFDSLGSKESSEPEPDSRQPAPQQFTPLPLVADDVLPPMPPVIAAALPPSGPPQVVPEAVSPDGVTPAVLPAEGVMTAADPPLPSAEKPEPAMPPPEVVVPPVPLAAAASPQAQIAPAGLALVPVEPPLAPGGPNVPVMTEHKPKSAMDKAKLDSLHQAMTEFTASVHDLSETLGRGPTENILGSIFDAAVKQALSGDKAEGRAMDTHTNDDVRQISSKNVAPSKKVTNMGKSVVYDSAGVEDNSDDEPSSHRDAIQGKAEDMQDLGTMLGRDLAEHILGSILNIDVEKSSSSELKTSDQMAEPETSGHGQDFTKSGQSANIQAKSSSRLGHSVSEQSVMQRDGHHTFTRTTHCEDGNCKSVNSNKDMRHKTETHSGDDSDDSVETLGRDFAENILGSIFEAAVKTANQADGTAKHHNSESSAQGSQDAQSSLDGHKKALAPITKRELEPMPSHVNSNGGSLGSSASKQELSTGSLAGSRLRGSQSQRMRSSETHIENGMRVTREKMCAGGHCKTVVTTEDLVEPLDPARMRPSIATDLSDFMDGNLVW